MSVTPAMIAVALGQAAPEPDSVQEQQWNLWVSDAEMLIDTRKTLLGYTDTIDEAKLDYVVREAVIAHIKRPDDATQVSVAIDDGSSQKTYRSGKGRVTILDEWWILLGLTEDSGAFSIDMANAGTVHASMCNLYFGGLSCSCGADIAWFPIYEDDYE